MSFFLQRSVSYPYHQDPVWLICTAMHTTMKWASVFLLSTEDVGATKIDLRKENNSATLHTRYWLYYYSKLLFINLTSVLHPLHFNLTSALYPLLQQFCNFLRLLQQFQAVSYWLHRLRSDTLEEVSAELKRANSFLLVIGRVACTRWSRSSIFFYTEHWRSASRCAINQLLSRFLLRLTVTECFHTDTCMYK